MFGRERDEIKKYMHFEYIFTVEIVVTKMSTQARYFHSGTQNIYMKAYVLLYFFTFYFLDLDLHQM